MLIDIDEEIKISNQNHSFDFLWLEYRHYINRQLYEEKIITYDIYKKMEYSLLSRQKKMINDF